MRKRIGLSLALAAAATLLLSIGVLAAYQVLILVQSSSDESYTQVGLNMTLDVEYLADEGFIDPTGLDTRVSDSSGNVLPHMLAEDRLMWVADMPAGASREFILWTGQELMDSVPVIPGYGGYVTVADNATIELGDVYAIVLTAYIDTAAGSNKNIVRKDSALLFSVTGAGEITFAVTGGNSLVATGLDSGSYAIIVICDGVEMWMEVDEVEVDREDASTIPNNANTWYLFENDVCPYVWYYGMWRVT